MYNLEGRILEVCDCNVLCPCWVGEDPDNGTCHGLNCWHIDRGEVNGVDVSGLTFVALVRIPGNVLKGNWQALIYVDDRATPEQEKALRGVWSGQLGGPVANVANLIGSVLAVERVPIAFDVEGGKGTVKVGHGIRAELAPFRGPDGQATALHDSIFSTIPGSPAYVGKAERYWVDLPEHEFHLDLEGHNAIQGTFAFAAA